MPQPPDDEPLGAIEAPIASVPWSSDFVTQTIEVLFVSMKIKPSSTHFHALAGDHTVMSD